MLRRQQHGAVNSEALRKAALLKARAQQRQTARRPAVMDRTAGSARQRDAGQRTAGRAPQAGQDTARQGGGGHDGQRVAHGTRHTDSTSGTTAQVAGEEGRDER
jgi:hypothetical protein